MYLIVACHKFNKTFTLFIKPLDKTELTIEMNAIKCRTLATEMLL